jgi:hypothetical protein
MICCSEDRRICEKLLGAARRRGDGAKPFPELVVEAGRHFLGAPYLPDTLEREGPEELVVNLRAFDCVTFVENAVALAGLIHTGSTDFLSYAAAIEKLRYRHGRCNGFPSRLHYFTDWLFDNGRKGLVRDITAGLGGVPYRKRFHALTDRRGELPGLADPAAYRRMRIIEGICSRRPLFHLPKENWQGIEAGIAAGDLVAITTDQAGIDVSHVGIAVRFRGALHLLHASSAVGSVLITEGTLHDYLREKPSRTGVIVGISVR